MSNTNLPQYFSGFIQEGKIFAQNYEGNTQVGVTLKEYAALQKKFDEVSAGYMDYQKRLIELGEIEVELTPEETVKQQSAQINQLQSVVLQLTNQVQTLIGAVNEHNVPRSTVRGEQSDSERTDNGSGEHRHADEQAEQLAPRVDEVRQPARRKSK